MFRVAVRLAAVLVVVAIVAGVVYLAVPSGNGGSDDRWGTGPASFDASAGRRRGHRPVNRDWEGGEVVGRERGGWDGGPEGGHGREQASVGRGLFGAGATALQVGVVAAVTVVAARRRSRSARARK